MWTVKFVPFLSCLFNFSILYKNINIRVTVIRAPDSRLAGPRSGRLIDASDFYSPLSNATGGTVISQACEQCTTGFHSPFLRFHEREGYILRRSEEFFQWRGVVIGDEFRHSLKKKRLTFFSAYAFLLKTFAVLYNEIQIAPNDKIAIKI